MDGFLVSLHIFSERLDEFRPKVFPRSNLFRSRRGRENRRFTVWCQLTEGFLVTMIRLILGDEDKIWLAFQLFKVGYAWLGLLV